MTNSWIRLFLGAWIIISPWILGFSEISLAKWSNIVVGVIMLILSLWELFGDEEEQEKEESKKQ
ncbi:MAG: SPW repeat protein [Patescibacteria group bacterium]